MNDEIKTSPAVAEPQPATSPSPPVPQPAADQGFTTLNISGESLSTRWADSEALRNQMQSGARWFFWVAGLSLINSIAAISDSNWSFLAGLGITQFISAFAVGLSEDLGGSVTIVALVLDVLVAGFFVFLGVVAQKGHTGAFVLGLVVYTLDALIFLAFQMWFPLAFHIFVSYCIYRGLSAKWKLERLEPETSGAG